MIEKARNWLNSEKNFLYALFGFSLLIRLAYVLPLPAGKLSPDAYDWINGGWSIAHGTGFGGSWRPPGYAFFLAAIFFIFGKSVVAARVMQALLGALTCLLTYRTGKKIFTENTGRIAGALAGFYPYFIAYTGDLLSETFLTFMLAAAIYQIVKTAEAPYWKNLALTGILIGLTGLTKSVVLPFFALACAWLWWQTGKFRTAFLAGVFTLLTIAPWTLRNYFHYDKSYVMPVSTPWFSLYGSSCDEALLNETTGDILKGPGVERIDQFLPPDWEYAAALPLPERDKYCKEKALGWIKNNPRKFTWLLYRRSLHFWRLYPVIAYGREKAAAMATSGLYIPLAVIGFFLSLPAFKRTSLLLALFLSYTLVNIFFATMIRYRVPIDPFVIMFAACTIERAYTALHIRKS
ncbi:MAG: glycosyltransferase family 39 protein [Elusimicrobia bacterium]|nr:glycosyltransferase family 39 protein [Elusimicrobiota bacterium]